MYAKGFDELRKSLNKLMQNAEGISGKNCVSLDELFTGSFMKKHTEFSSLEKLL